MDIDRAQATADLARGEKAASRIRNESRWFARYLAVFAAGFGVLTLVLGLVDPLWLRLTVSGVLWIPLVIGMVVWAVRQRASPDGAGRRALPGWIGTGVLYGVALFVGTPAQLGNAAYWLPAAVVVVLPLGIAAWREWRR